MFKRNASILSLLTLASLFSATLAVGRFHFSGSFRFTFLIWNLFLAWLPVGFAWFASRQLRDDVEGALAKRPFTLLLSLLWLLFLPNAPYLVTDIIHLQPMKHTPFWFDAMMLLSFAVTGLLLGFLSLNWMQTAVQQRYNRRIGWLFALTALVLTGLGVYIGRVLRWNSWDVFTRPTAVLADIFYRFISPDLAWRAWGLTGLLVGMLVGGYLLLASWRPVVVMENGR